MPYLSSDPCNQIFSYDPTFYSSVEEDDLYPENVSDEFFCGSELPHLRKDGFNLESEAFDYHFIEDELCYNQDEQANSKNDYFNHFWGENWLFSLKSSSNCSDVGEMHKSETPHPDEEQAIWRKFNYNHDNEFPREDGLKNMYLWKNCYDFFNVHSGLYGYIADERPSKRSGGFSPFVDDLRDRERRVKPEADEPSLGYGEAASQEP